MQKTIYINGANGRVGQALNALATDETWYRFSTDIKTADLVIDFSSPTGLLEGLSLSQQHSIPFLSGTTGIEQQHLDALDKAGQDIAILWSANMSIGMNLLYQLSAKLATQ